LAADENGFEIGSWLFFSCGWAERLGDFVIRINEANSAGDAFCSNELSEDAVPQGVLFVPAIGGVLPFSDHIGALPD
jgi:hypothetical protein